MDMPWTHARDFVAATARLRREALLEGATAVRAAQADAETWHMWAATMAADGGQA